MLHVTLLGVSGMMPTVDRWLSSAFMESNGDAYLVDCGEGTQYATRKYGCNLTRLKAIFFTHYHLDHILGLPGVLISLNNMNRKEPLFLFGPKGLQHFLKRLLQVLPQLNYKVELCDLGDKRSSLSFDNLDVEAVPMEHTVPCLGYSFKINRCGKFDEVRAKNLPLDSTSWSVLQLGYRIREDGTTYCNSDLFGSARKGLKVVYATDTRPNQGLLELTKDADLAILEGMYSGVDGDNGVSLASMIQNAETNKHMMFGEAAELAKNAGVKELWLTHFSPMNTKPQASLKTIKKIFPNTKCGSCGLNKTLEFKK